MSRTSDSASDSTGERSVALQVFLNYRREDASGHAGHLFDELAGLGRYDVFMDIEKIDPGIPFREAINGALATCDVFLALVGPRWLDAKDSSERRRLENPNDLVRLEIEGALAREGVRVVPVLLQGVDMPTADKLPEPLLGLIDRHALELSDTRWDYDVEQLVLVLDTIAAKKTEQEDARRQEDDRKQEDERRARELEAAEAARRWEERKRRELEAAEQAEHGRTEDGLSRRARLLLAGLAVTAVVALGVVAAVLLFSGNGEPGPTTEAGDPTTAPTTTPTTEPDEPVGDPLDSAGVPFPFDGTSGTGAQLPIRLTFDEGDRVPETIPEELGFTGLMTNGERVNELFDSDDVVVDGGVLRILAGPGDPIQARNTQQNAFQLGVGTQDGPFTAHVRLPEPFGDVSEVVDFQSLGLFVGTGDQDNYIKLVAGSQGVELLREIEGVRTARRRALELPGPAAVDLYVTVDPAAPSVAAWFADGTTGEPGPTTWADAQPELRFPRQRIPRSWLDDPDSGLAVGVISTTGLPGDPFWAAWDLFEVTRQDAAGSP